jgi:hypothetical protein
MKRRPGQYDLNYLDIGGLRPLAIPVLDEVRRVSHHAGNGCRQGFYKFYRGGDSDIGGFVVRIVDCAAPRCVIPRAAERVENGVGARPSPDGGLRLPRRWDRFSSLGSVRNGCVLPHGARRVMGAFSRKGLLRDRANRKTNPHGSACPVRLAQIRGPKLPRHRYPAMAARH